jgi:hypothetical protein
MREAPLKGLDDCGRAEGSRRLKFGGYYDTPKECFVTCAIFLGFS